MRNLLALVLIITAAGAMAEPRGYEPNGYMKIPDIDGEDPTSQIRAGSRQAKTSVGPLYPAGWESFDEDGLIGPKTIGIKPTEPAVYDASSPYIAR